MNEEEFMKEFEEFKDIFNIVPDCFADWYICFNKNACDVQEKCKIRSDYYVSRNYSHK